MIDIWKISGDSNIYFLDLEEKIVIDAGNLKDRRMILRELSRLIPIDRIEKVLFTHLHFDHIGNFDIFPRARFFASRNAIGSLQNDPIGTILDEGLAKRFSARLEEFEEMRSLQVIDTPGHTFGSVCFYYGREKALFSGDTIFGDNIFGRTDLPTSRPEMMKESLEKIRSIDYKILYPGHDY